MYPFIPPNLESIRYLETHPPPRPKPPKPKLAYVKARDVIRSPADTNESRIIVASSVIDEPHSRRVGVVSRPSDFRLSGLTNDSYSPPSSPTIFSPVTPPALPPRSALRDLPRTSISSGESFPYKPVMAEDLSDYSYLNQSVPSFSMLLDSAKLNIPVSPPLSAQSSTSSLEPPNAPPMSKRHHALHELLSSERSYASDLALLRDVHIPLALGHPLNLPASPPESSGASSRTTSTASDSSGFTIPPMTPEDVKLIFGNIAELALLSDLFSDQLESALGDVVEGGSGPDRVGELFLQVIPTIELPYKEYITRHSTAFAHLTALPRTPSLLAYISQTQNIAASLSHAWDIASLLIKPVQRLLKYPLLLAAIIDETLDDHPDKDNLRKAKEQIEELARNVNEGKRRREVVRDVLYSGKKSGKTGETDGPVPVKKKSMNVGTAAGVSLTKVKGGLRTKPYADNEEAVAVARMEAELKRIEGFSETLAKAVLDWVKSMGDVIQTLNRWAINFGRVIGLSEDQGSEAFDAFMMVVNTQLLPLCGDLEVVVKEMFLVSLAKLRNTKQAPLKLINAMHQHEPAHHHLLTMNVTPKNRPDAALLEASQNYLALRGQLHAELPAYLASYHKGLGLCIYQLASIQVQFWADVRDRWGSLWDALRVEGERNAGAEETISVWWGRWHDVDRYVSELNIINLLKLHSDKMPLHKLHNSSSHPSIATPKKSFKDGKGSHVLSNLTSLNPTRSFSESRSNHNGSNVTTTLGLLDPNRPEVSSPQPLTPRRSRGNSDAAQRYGDNRKSGDSSKSTSSTRTPSKKGQPRPESFGEYVDVIAPPFVPSMPPRTKSMPIPYKSPSIQQSASVSSRKTLPSPHDGNDHERGRPNSPHSPQKRRPSRKNTEDLAQSLPHAQMASPPKPRLHRSGSLSSPTPPATAFTRRRSSSRPRTRSLRDEWLKAPTKYECVVIHPCHPPQDVSYRQISFFTLAKGDVLQVVQEAGHPSLHEGLPLHIDDGEDTLLLTRDRTGEIGWALASFLIPLD